MQVAVGRPARGSALPPMGCVSLDPWRRGGVRVGESREVARPVAVRADGRWMKPRSVVFDLFGDHLRYHGGAARTQALVDLLQVFDVGEPTARIVLARMRKEGWFETRREGRQVVYTLTDKAWQLLDEGRTRIFERTHPPWDGQWRMVIYAVPEQDRAERERLRRTLSWLGFGPLATATWMSPHERLDDVERALPDTSARLDLLTCRSRDRATDLDMVERCWDLKALGRDYQDFVIRLQRAAREVRARPLARPRGAAAAHRAGVELPALPVPRSRPPGGAAAARTGPVTVRTSCSSLPTKRWRNRPTPS